jgi:hypothetical protein
LQQEYSACLSKTLTLVKLANRAICIPSELKEDHKNGFANMLSSLVLEKVSLGCARPERVLWAANRATLGFVGTPNAIVTDLARLDVRMILWSS